MKPFKGLAMQLRFSSAARNRAFSKAMRRIRSDFLPLLEAFQAVKLEHPIHESILVIITDDRPAQYFEEIENSDGYFQVLAGCTLRGGDEELVADVFEILRNTTRLCPFATPDQAAFEALFQRMRPLIVNH